MDEFQPNGQRPRLAWLATATMLVCLLTMAWSAGCAFASSGEITLAETDPSWTTVDVAGSVTWTGCTEAAHCDWFAVVKDQATPEECSGNIAPIENESVETVWTSAPQTSNGSVTFNTGRVPSLLDASGQRACLFVFFSHRPSIECGPYMGCPPNEFLASELMGSKVFSVEAPQSERPPGGTESGNAPSGITPPSRAAVLATLTEQLRPGGKGAARSRLLRAGSYTMSFEMPEAGTLVVEWYRETPAAKHLSAKPALLARGTTSFATATRSPLRVSLTREGRALLRRDGELKLTAVGSFDPVDGAALTAERDFTLRR